MHVVDNEVQCPVGSDVELSNLVSDVEHSHVVTDVEQSHVVSDLEQPMHSRI